MAAEVHFRAIYVPETKSFLLTLQDDRHKNHDFNVAPEAYRAFVKQLTDARTRFVELKNQNKMGVEVIEAKPLRLEIDSNGLPSFIRMVDYFEQVLVLIKV